MWRSFEIWLLPYLRHPKRAQFNRPTDVIFAVCDHFEPLHHSDKNRALERLKDWQTRWPQLTESFQDSDGHPPKQTFFYPIEQYDPDLIEELAQLCQDTGSEVEIHLHHHDDTDEQLRAALQQGKTDFERHQLLSTNREDQIEYGFIHGNWALDNSDPHGRHCGVQRELQVLKETGCYADFTMPSAPHPTQTETVNQIYYAIETESAKSHNHGYPATAPPSSQSTTKSALRPTSDLRTRPDHLLLIQGPLALNWKRRKWGILPRLENADLTGNNPPTPDRVALWLRNAIHVKNRPDWIFVKLHCHGAINPNRAMLLGEPMRQFHQHLKAQFGSDSPIRYHYVSAREMVNMVHAAEDGHQGNPNSYRNYVLKSRIPFKEHCLPQPL